MNRGTFELLALSLALAFGCNNKAALVTTSRQLEWSPMTLTLTAPLGVRGEGVIEFSNHGESPVFVSSITVGGATPAPFSVSSAQSFTVASGVSEEIVVIFTPRAVGTVSAELELQTNASGSSTITIDVQGICPGSSATTASSTGVSATASSSGTSSGSSSSSSSTSSSSGCASQAESVVMVETFSGNPPPADFEVDGPGPARFAGPVGSAMDEAGNLYVADSPNNQIRRVDPMGNVATYAGTGVAGWLDGVAVGDGGAEFNNPTGVAVNASGTVYVVDQNNNRIRAIAPSGMVSTVAGNGAVGAVDGAGGPSGVAEFNGPQGIAVDATGNLYVSDTLNNLIRRVEPTGTVTTLAGTGVAGFADSSDASDGGAQFSMPLGIAVDATGKVYVADQLNQRIRMIDSTGQVTTVAGTGVPGWVDGPGGPGGTAEFNQPAGVAVDPTGNIYVADAWNNVVRRIDSSSNVTTYSGNGLPGYANGTGGAEGTTQFFSPAGVTVGPSGEVYVSDYENTRIRLVAPTQVATTLAGSGVSGSVDGTAPGVAEANTPLGLTLTPSGSFVFTEAMTMEGTPVPNPSWVRSVDALGAMSQLAGTGTPGWVDGPASTAEFAAAAGIVADAQGNLYLAEVGNNDVRTIGLDGTVSTLAGNGSCGYADGTGGRTGTAEFCHPLGLAIDGLGNLYVADQGNNRIRLVTPDGMVSTLAGNACIGDAGYGCYADGTAGLNGTASFNQPYGVAVDAAGENVYVADTGNNRIRKISNGSVTTFSGNGYGGWADGTGGPTGTAEFYVPANIAVDGLGNVYVDDAFNRRLRKLDPSGAASTLAGNGGYNGPIDGTGGPDGTAEIGIIGGIVIDGTGVVYFFDTGVLKKVVTISAATCN